MTENVHSTEVLIIGAGPVGMTAAILLASTGISVTVVEKNAGTANDPKAISLDDESLRAYARAGIAKQVMQVIVPGTGTTYFDADGRKLFHGGAAVPLRSGFPFKNPFAQPELERVLRRALENHPLVKLRFNTTLTELASDEMGVHALVTKDGEAERINAEFVLGADGGRSTVRNLTGITMSGRSHQDVWLVIDCLDDEHDERYGMHYGDPRRPHVIVPGLHGRCRYEFYLHPGECEPTTNPPFDLIRKLLVKHRAIEPEQVERAVAYRFHGLSADKWREGRAFLLGDAAHMMPPFAGQGLNSGIRDAANLSWKLAAVLRDSAPISLLDTYEEERRPHAEAVIRSSERLGRVVMTTNERLARFRDRVIREALAKPEGRAFFEEMQYRPSTRVLRGLVLGAENEALVGTGFGQPRVFDFSTHAIVAFDTLAGPGWSIIGVGVGRDTSNETWGRAVAAFTPLAPQFIDVPLEDHVHDRRDPVRVAIDVDGRLYAETKHARGKFIVLRPDRVIAAVVTPGSLASVGEALCTQSASRAPLAVAS